MLFEVKGSYSAKGRSFQFTRKLEALNENRAREIALSLTGSEHGAKRNLIRLESVTKIQGEK